MTNKPILLIEDNKDDELLTLRAFKKNRVRNEIIVVRDGAMALDYLFGTGDYAGRDMTVQPQLVLLDLNLPRVSGLDVLKRMRADPRTRFLAVIILTSSKQDEDVINGYSLGANSYVRKPVDLAEFTAALSALSVYWLLIHEPAPGS